MQQTFKIRSYVVHSPEGEERCATLEQADAVFDRVRLLGPTFIEERYDPQPLSEET